MKQKDESFFVRAKEFRGERGGSGGGEGGKEQMWRDTEWDKHILSSSAAQLRALRHNAGPEFLLRL